MKEVTISRGYKALVDEEDYERVNQFKWSFCNNGRNHGQYARRYIGGISFQKMTNFILNVDSSIMIDHKDNNGLNNQKSNLRICTRAQNNKNKILCHNNTSGYKGVHFDNNQQRWRARIAVDYKRISLGFFDTADEAARAYDEAAIKYHGEFAKTNRELGLYPDQANVIGEFK